MSITLPLDKMSTIERIQTMEELWDALCHEKIDIKSVFNIVMELKDEISSMKKVEPISNDKEKENVREEARKKAKKS